MGSCLNFNLVRYRAHRLRAFYRSKGLKSQLIPLANGSTIHCWVQRHEDEPKQSSRRSQSQAPPNGHLREGQSHAPPNGHLREGQSHAPPNGHLREGQSHAPPNGHLPEGQRRMQEGVVPQRRFWRGQSQAPANGHLREGQRRMQEDGVPQRRFWRSQSRAPANGYFREGQSRMHEDEVPKWRSWRGQAEARSSKPLHERPALVFIHGFGGDGTVGWEHQIATFTKDYRVFVPDLLFFGTSTTTNTQRTEIFQADCIMEMLTKLNVQVTHVVGASYGGFVAFWMAYKYPRLCWKVVLSSSGICMNPRTNDSLLMECNLNCIEDILLPTTVDALKLAFSLLYVKPPGLPDFIVQQVHDVYYAEADRKHRLELLNALVIGSEKCPPLPILTQQDVLIIWGREDQIFNLPLAYQLQQHLGERRVHVAIIERAGHMPQVEKSKEYNAILSNFLDDHNSEESL